MNAYANYIVFKTDSLFNDKVQYKGVDGKDLVIDPSFDPAKHVRCYGEVVSLPLHLTKRPVSQEHRGTPAYSEESPFEYKFISDVSRDIEVGDRIYFHFNTICEKNFVKVEGTHPNRTWYYKVSYEQVLCAVRAGKIIPIASYVLCDPDFESWDDILLPVRSDIKGPDGQYLMKPKDQWIQTKTKPEYKYLTAFVRYVGKPFNGDQCEIEVGQKVWYRRNADWMNKVEGRDYFAIRQRHIVGKEVDGEFVPIRNYMLVSPEPEPTETDSGIVLKAKMSQRGTVVHPGTSGFAAGEKVEFGCSDRTEIEIKKEKYLLIKKGDVFGIHQRNAKTIM